MKRIYLITGAGGFLGNTVARHISLQPGDEIRALLLPKESSKSLEGIPCSIYRGDITQKESLTSFFQVPAGFQIIVIHCAAVVSIGSRFDESVFRVNVLGTENVGELCQKVGGTLIYVSSVHAIQEGPEGTIIRETKNFDPEQVQGFYAKSKALAAQAILRQVEQTGLRACIVHPSGLIGPGDYGNTHMTHLILQAMEGHLPAIVKGGYDFVDVRDVAMGILSAVDRGKSGETYLLTNRYATISQVVDLVARTVKRRKIRTVIPLWTAKLTAPVMETYSRWRKTVPLFTGYSLYTLQSNSNFSHEKADQELGYRNRPLEVTIRDTVTWLKRSHRFSKQNWKTVYSLSTANN